MFAATEPEPVLHFTHTTRGRKRRKRISTSTPAPAPTPSPAPAPITTRPTRGGRRVTNHNYARMQRVRSSVSDHHRANPITITSVNPITSSISNTRISSIVNTNTRSIANANTRTGTNTTYPTSEKKKSSPRWYCFVKTIHII